MITRTTPYSTRLSDRVREVLKRKRIKQRSVALKLGISSSHFSSLLCGEHEFTLPMVLKLEKVLGEKLIEIV